MPRKDKKSYREYMRRYMAQKRRRKKQEDVNAEIQNYFKPQSMEEINSKALANLAVLFLGILGLTLAFGRRRRTKAASSQRL